jgi:hypothetical protein
MKRHSTDAVSLVFGVIFIAVAVWWLVDTYLFINLNIPNVGWIAAGALIMLGALGVVFSLRGERPNGPERDGGDEFANGTDPDPLTDTAANPVVGTASYPGAASEPDDRA